MHDKVHLFAVGKKKRTSGPDLDMSTDADTSLRDDSITDDSSVGPKEVTTPQKTPETTSPSDDNPPGTIVITPLKETPTKGRPLHLLKPTKFTTEQLGCPFLVT